MCIMLIVMGNSNKETTIFVRVKADTKDMLRDLAEDKGLNISTYCRTILLKELKEIEKQGENYDTNAT